MKEGFTPQEWAKFQLKFYERLLSAVKSEVARGSPFQDVSPVERTKSRRPKQCGKGKRCKMEKRTDSWSLRLANLVHTRLGANYTGPAYLSGPSLLPAWSLQWPSLTFRPATQSTKENSEVNSPEPRWNLITKCCSKIQECVCFPLNLMEIKTFDKNSPWKYFSFYAMLYAS